MNLPPPGHPDAPNFWMNEVSGVLEGPITRYLKGEPLSLEDIGAIRAYLRQWIDSPVWDGPGIDELRVSVRQIETVGDLNKWIFDALEEGHDPL